MQVAQTLARTDNYIYLLREENSKNVIVIDPTDAEPVLRLCAENRWAVHDILLTHHHNDHIGGVPGILEKFPAALWGFSGDQHRLPPLTHALKDGDSFTLQNFRFNVKHIPAHTLGHIAYFMPEPKFLFCGDTLFSMGCGRLFEGTPEMMFANLEWMKTLPTDTQVFCGHEYTQTNTEFALSLEPNNPKLKTFYDSVVEKRKNKKSTVPFSLGRDIELNPMFRWNDPSLRTALHLENASDLEVFTAVRSRRNHWPP